MKRKCLFCEKPVKISKEDVDWKCSNQDCGGVGIIEKVGRKTELAYGQGNAVLIAEFIWETPPEFRHMLVQRNIPCTICGRSNTIWRLDTEDCICVYQRDGELEYHRE